MSMSPRLLRPRQTLHPEAASWASRVVANGGTVSGTTLSAVDKFCKAIASAGIRDRFYRLNLFAGTGLNACLVPLYRAASLGDTQLGNATDTNTGGLFVSGDYAETTGLTAGSTKQLETGLAPDNMPLAVVQAMALSFAHGPTPSSDLDPRPLGAVSATDRFNFTLTLRTGASGLVNATLGRTTSLNSANMASGSQPSASWIASRTLSTSLIIYKNGVSDATLPTSVTPIASHAFPFFVCRSNNQGSPIGDAAAVPYRHYSIGGALTGAQAASYESALSAFRTALGRTA